MKNKTGETERLKNNRKLSQIDWQNKGKKLFCWTYTDILDMDNNILEHHQTDA